MTAQANLGLDEEIFAPRFQGPEATQADDSQTTLLDSLLSPKIRFLLIKGEPGSGKTTLAFDLLAKFGRGLYVSTRSSLEQASLQNGELRELIQKGLISEPKARHQHGVDYEDSRLGSPQDLLQSILEAARKAKGEETLVVLDSWDAFAKTMDSVDRQKTEQSMFAMSEANKLRLLFVSEFNELTNMDYMADAVIVLQDEIFEGQRIRRIIWKKLRGFEIPKRSYPYTLYEGRFSMLEGNQLFAFPKSHHPRPFLATPHTPERFSTGCDDLDRFLGGGFPRGAFVLLELASKIGSTSHVPLLSTIIGNFLANDGCALSLPSVGLTPKMIKSVPLRRFSPEVLDTSVRIFHFDSEIGQDSDPCFVRLDASSLSKTAEIIKKASADAKGPQNRPCFLFLGMETLEYVFGAEKLGRLGVTLNQQLKNAGDLAICGAKNGSALISSLSNSCDLHLKLDQVDGALMLFSVKPPSRLYHLKYDFEREDPVVELKPMV